MSLATSLILLACLSDDFTCAENSTACRFCAQERRETGAEASYDAAGAAGDSGAFVGLCEGLEVLEGMRACVGR